MPHEPTKNDLKWRVKFLRKALTARPESLWIRRLYNLDKAALSTLTGDTRGLGEARKELAIIVPKVMEGGVA